MHDINKLDIDLTSTHMTSKNLIRKHGEKALAAIYKEYIQLEDMEVMGAMYPTDSQDHRIKYHYGQ